MTVVFVLVVMFDVVVVAVALCAHGCMCVFCVYSHVFIG